MFLFATAAFAALFASEAAVTPQNAETGKILIYRTAGLGGIIQSCPIRVRGKEIVILKPGRFAEWGVAPGRYILTNKASSVEVNVAPGETRYVRCDTGTGSASIQVVDEADFAPRRDRYKREEIATLGE